MTALAHAKPAPSLPETMEAYLGQLSLSLRPQSVACFTSDLKLFAAFLADNHPEVRAAGDLERRHIESFKRHMATATGTNGHRLSTATVRRRLSTLRMFLERIMEWGWDDAPARALIFTGDLPKRDEALPRFLDDARFAAFMRAARSEPRPLLRLALELLGRTGMRVGELCGLEADATVKIGDSHWLRIPVGKLHNDRYIPLHPQLVDMLEEWSQHPDCGVGGRMLNNEGRPLNRHAVARMCDRCARKAGIGHVHPHQLRHTVATQAVNRGMSLEAIAALLGHRSMSMTMTYARIADRTVADEYFAVSEKVEALYDKAPVLPANAEGPSMRRMRREHYRMLGNGLCTRPVELDCAFETICEGCTYFATTIEFRPTLRRQLKDATRKGQTGRQKLFSGLLEGIEEVKDPEGE
ncbi:MAG: tyrosine-type recombinase/integrase [Acidimicrobiales bacterium]